MADWIQIDPTLTETGAFAALAGLPRCEEMKPVPFKEGMTPFGTRFDDVRHYDLSIATQLGIASVADAATTFQAHVYAHDLVYYTPVTIHDHGIKEPNGGLIYGNWWGAGLRIRVQVMRGSVKAKLNLAAAAAEASLGIAEASFTVEAMGIADRSLLKLLPEPGRFDTTMLQRIMRAKGEFEEQALKPRKNLKAVPLTIWVQDPSVSFGGLAGRGRAQLYAIRRIRGGVSQVKAVAAASRAGVDPMTVQLVYEQWAKTTPASPNPDVAAKEKAKRWLEKSKA